MDANKVRKEIEGAIHNIDANEEGAEMLTKRLCALLYRRYLALKEAGFTAQQAFEIILKRGLD